MTEAEENRRRKSEEKQVKENEYRLRFLESCESLVRSILTVGIDHINILKVKELRVLLRYRFGTERLEGSQKKLELVEAADNLFRGEWEGLIQRVGEGG